MHHTRNSGQSSPLVFDPEIERTARKTRVLHRENKVLQSPILTTKTMENLRNADKQVTDTFQPPQFSPSPTQPSPNTTRPLEPPSSTTQLPPMPPPPFSNLDNLPPLSNQPTSSQYPLFTQTSHISHSSPYVRIVDDEQAMPPSQTRPDNASTSIPRPLQHQHGSYGVYSGEFGNGEDEDDGYEMQGGRQVVNTDNLYRSLLIYFKVDCIFWF